MASSLNASTSGGGGVIVTSYATGNLDIQSGGSTVVAVTSTGATVTGTLAATGAITGSSTVAGSTGILYPLTSGTAVATTSGTSIDFTSIPSWVKRITVMFNGVSSSGTSLVQLQIGAGSVDATGYSSTAAGVANTGNTVTAIASTTGFLISSVGTATNTLSGAVRLTLLGSNMWVSDGSLSQNGGGFVGGFTAGGVKTASGTLDRIRLTTVNGTDTFDAGSINILYE